MEPLTLFAFGYKGWGSTTAQLVEAIDKVEASRGFGPPVFVDVRLAREVRAKGFAGKAFETLLGKPRYRWIPDLGNPGVKEGGDTRIKNPAAASLLLELAESLSAAATGSVLLPLHAPACRGRARVLPQDLGWRALASSREEAGPSCPNRRVARWRCPLHRN